MQTIDAFLQGQHTLLSSILPSRVTIWNASYNSLLTSSVSKKGWLTTFANTPSKTELMKFHVGRCFSFMILCHFEKQVFFRGKAFLQIADKKGFFANDTLMTETFWFGHTTLANVMSCW